MKTKNPLHFQHYHEGAGDVNATNAHSFIIFWSHYLNSLLTAGRLLTAVGTDVAHHVVVV